MQMLKLRMGQHGFPNAIGSTDIECRPMKIRTIFLSWTLSTVAVIGMGCDSKSSSGQTRPNASNPDTPVPQTPAPVPVPDMLSTDALPFEEGKLNVVAAFPGPGEPQVALVSPISVQFDAQLIQGLDLENAITVSLNESTAAGSITLQEPDTLVFRPANLWQPSSVYTIAVDPALMSADGLEITENIHWQFITVDDVYTTPQSVIDECMSDLDIEMLAAVNNARAEARLCGENQRPAVEKLQWSCLLQEAAIAHSDDMSTQDFFDHTGSDGSDVGDRITRTGYVWSHAGENLAAGQRTVTTVMQGLLDSPKHCDNIMSDFYTEFGFGFRVNSNTFYTRYWTQNFARPFRF